MPPDPDIEKPASLSDRDIFLGCILIIGTVSALVLDFFTTLPLIFCILVGVGIMVGLVAILFGVVLWMLFVADGDDPLEDFDLDDRN